MHKVRPNIADNEYDEGALYHIDSSAFKALRRWQTQRAYGGPIGGNNWNELELDPGADLDPSIDVLAKGVNNLLELIPFREVEISPLPHLGALTVSEINFTALKVA